MKLFSYRQMNGLGALLCGIYLGAAFLLECYQSLQPCPLCILQRWVVALLLIFFLIGSLHARTSFQGRFYGILTLLIALLGIFLSGRHLWLLNHPPETMGVCAPNLLYLFKQLPFIKATKTLFWGSGECATMAGSFLGISIPFWTLLGFLSLFLISLWQIVRNVRKNPSMPRW